jgi:hypothetical protein
MGIEIAHLSATTEQTGLDGTLSSLSHCGTLLRMGGRHFQETAALIDTGGKGAGQTRGTLQVSGRDGVGEEEAGIECLG